MKTPLHYKLLSCAAACLLLTSCATTITRRSYRMRVDADRAGVTVLYADSTYPLPAHLHVRRSKAALVLRFEADGQVRNVRVKAVPNTAFLYGNLAWGPFAPAAYGIDFTNPKRFYYGRNLHLHVADTATLILPRLVAGPRNALRAYGRRSFAPERGDIIIQLSNLFANHFYLQPEGEGVKDRAGFLGIAAGIGYGYRSRRSIDIAGGTQWDLPAPFPAGKYFGRYERLSSSWIGMQHRHYSRKLMLGYGIAFSRNKWELNDAGDTASSPLRTSTSAGVGPMFSAGIILFRQFAVGLSYRTTLLRTASAGTGYEHVAGMDLSLRLRVRKGKTPALNR